MSQQRDPYYDYVDDDSESTGRRQEKELDNVKQNQRQLEEEMIRGQIDQESQKSRSFQVLIIAVCCTIILTAGIVFLILYLGFGWPGEPDVVVTSRDGITPMMDPYFPNPDCQQFDTAINYNNEETFPHFTTQCECNDEVIFVPVYIQEEYSRLSIVLGVDPDSMESCDSSNLSLLIVAAGSVTSQPRTNSNTSALLQQYTLSEFYYELAGPQWRAQAFWLNDDDVCRWAGIVCNDGNQVVEIHLDDNRLQGELPLALYELTHLTVFSASQNSLSGTISNNLYTIPDIRSIDVSSNSFTGEVPIEDLESASSLEELNFGDNQLDGELPIELFESTTLEAIDLSNNQIDGTLPSLEIVQRDIARYSRLFYLNLYGNQFEGTIPTQLGELTRLRSLNIGGNLLRGTIPIEDGLDRLRNLLDLYVGENPNIEGSVPDFRQMTNLESISLSGTNIRSRIDFGVYPNQLLALNLSNSLVGGYIQNDITTMTNLNILDLSGSQFRQYIPTNIARLTRLTYLALNDNMFEGNITTYFGRLTNLETLLLHNNMFHNQIPTELGLLSSLETLTLEGTMLTGRTPERVCRLREEGALTDFSTECPTHFNGVLCAIPSCCTSCYISD